MTVTKTATLVMEDSSSFCSRCRGNADPNETSHVHGGPGSMYEKGSSLECRNGCGALFVKVDSVYENGYVRKVRRNIERALRERGAA